MNTFALIVNRNLNQKQLEAYATNTRNRLSRSGEDIEQQVRLCPDDNCGWFWLRTADAHPGETISEAYTDHYAVIAYGGVLGASGTNTAQVICNAWAKGGASEISKLDGNFGAVVVDRIERSVHLLSDIVGHRALRYYVNELMFVISPHDVPLVATGLVPVNFDLETAASINAIDWSVGGKSLLRDIHTADGGEHICWNSGRIRHYPQRIIDPSTRIELGDRSAIRKNVNELVAGARANVRDLVKGSAKVYTSLTAGRDSRAVFALLLSELAPNQIAAVTSGTPENLDVSVAARIAKMYRVPHQIDDAGACDFTVSGFARNVDALAFDMNGDTNAKRAITLVRALARDEIHFNGLGGEVFRGFYYVQPRSEARMPLTPAEILRRLDRQASDLPWLTPEYSSAVSARIADRVRELSEQSDNGYDILDLYYLRDRYRIWAATSSRTYLGRRTFSPLISPSMVRLGYRLPPPIGDHAAYTYECIRRFAPRAYFIRINGSEFAPFNPRTSSSALLSYINRSARRLGKKISNSLHHSEKSRNGRGRRGAPAAGTSDAVRSNAFVGPLFEYIRELLTEDRSIASELFGRKGVEQLLDEHASGARNNLDVLGVQVTIEHYRKLIDAALRDARLSGLQGARYMA